MEQEKLIRVLADGQFHSGEELGVLLGITRAGIWKKLEKLTEAGFRIQRVKGKGYRLEEPFELLNEKEIKANLDERSKNLFSRMEIFQEIDSTNQMALRQIQETRQGGMVYLAESQTSGKGRRGRHWVSPFGHNLYLTVSWVFDEGIKAIEGLSLALGVATVEAIAELGIEDIQLKWPNDLLWQDCKVGGILIEMEGDPAGEVGVVAGLGLNTAKSEAMESIDQSWTDLSSIAGSRVSRNRLAAVVLKHWLPLLADYTKNGFACYREQWLKHDRFAGLPVTLLMGPRTIKGMAKGVDEQGSLLLETEDGLLTFPGGEISLRGSSL